MLNTPNKWEIPHGDSPIKIPTGARILDESVKHPDICLYEIPLSVFKTPEGDDIFGYYKDADISSASFYAVCTQKENLRCLLISSNEVKSLEEVGSLIKRELEADRANLRLPAVWDMEHSWLLFPLTSDTSESLLLGHKSDLRGLHYQIANLNRLVNDLLGGGRIENLDVDDTLTSVNYLDLRMLSSGQVYLNATLNRMIPDMERLLETFGVITSDSLEIPTGDDSLLKYLVLLYPQVAGAYDKKKTATGLLMDAFEHADRSIVDGSTHATLRTGLLPGYRFSQVNQDFLNEFLGAYNESLGGFPVSVVLGQKPGESSYSVVVAQSHYEAAQDPFMTGRDPLACFNAHIRVAPIHGSSDLYTTLNDRTLNFTLVLESFAPNLGENTLRDEEYRAEITRILDQISEISFKDKRQREQGLTLACSPGLK